MLGIERILTPKGRLKAIIRDAETGELLHESPWFENLITTVGKQYFISAWNGAAARTLSNAQGGLLIGDGTTAANVADTNLAAATNKVRIALDAGFPSTTGTTTTYQFTVASGVGNFTHSEFGLTNASAVALADGVLITRLLAGPFTKSAAVTITYVYQLTQA